jgi:hypothetical protein
MKKLIFLLFEQGPVAPGDAGKAERRRRLLEGAAPVLLERGARSLQINVCDERVKVASPAPSLPTTPEPFVAQVNVWAEDDADPRPFEDALCAARFDVHSYLVDENIYTEYGDNAHAGPRTWPDGERSPGVLAVTLLARPAHIPEDEWMRRWFGRQSPMSEAMQPRSRYVRNVVRETLTSGAPVYEGIVEESWPSERHVTNPFLFYGASNPFALVKNVAVMLHSVTSFLTLWRISTVMLSEYFVRSER